LFNSCSGNSFSDSGNSSKKQERNTLILLFPATPFFERGVSNCSGKNFDGCSVDSDPLVIYFEALMNSGMIISCCAAFCSELKTD